MPTYVRAEVESNTLLDEIPALLFFSHISEDETLHGESF